MRISDWSSDVCSSDLDAWPAVVEGLVDLRGLGEHLRAVDRGQLDLRELRRGGTLGTRLDGDRRRLTGARVLRRGQVAQAQAAQRQPWLRRLRRNRPDRKSVV